MLMQDETTKAYSEFVRDLEPRLRHALIGAVGPDTARDATAEALAYGWENWDRLERMENPAGYLYRVARTAARRAHKREPLMPAVATDDTPWVEPGLPAALAALTERQRVAVWSVHGLGWSLGEVAQLLGISAESVRTHVRRGMKKLQRILGDGS